MTAEVEVSTVTERRLLGPITIRELLESQTVDVLRQATRHLLSSHGEAEVTNGPGLVGYTNVENDLGDVPQFTEEHRSHASLVMDPGSIQQTPLDGNSENTICAVADLINSIFEVKGVTGVGDDHQLTGSDTLTDGPSVKLARDSVQRKTDVVMDNNTQSELANALAVRRSPCRPQDRLCPSYPHGLCRTERMSTGYALHLRHN